MITNFRRIPVLVLGAAAPIALALIVAPLASAQPALTNDDIDFVTTLAHGNPAAGIAPVVPSPGHTQWDLAQLGHDVADDVRHGVNPFTEQDWFRLSNRTLSVGQVALLVTKAVRVWAPDFARWYFDCGTGPVCHEPLSAFWPPGAVSVPWTVKPDDAPGFGGDPGIPPFVNRGKCDYVHNCVLNPAGTGVGPAGTGVGGG